MKSMMVPDEYKIILVGNQYYSERRKDEGYHGYFDLDEV